MTEDREEPKKRLSADDRRKTLIQAAIKLFTEKGYHPTRMDEIAEEAGCTIGPLYHFYKTKADMFVGVLDFYVSVSLARARKTREELNDKSPLNRVRASPDFYLIGSQLKVVKMLLRDGPSVIGADEYNRVVDKLMLEQIESDLKEAMIENQIPPEPPRPLATFIVAAILMAYSRSTSEEDLELSKSAIVRIIDRLKLQLH